MSCKTCFNNCDPIVTDKCIKYTGVDVDELGICKGMALYEVEEIIFNKLVDLSDTEELSYSEIVPTCSFIINLLVNKSQPLSLQAFAELMFEAFCALDGKITALTPTTFSFDTTGLPGTPTTRDQIIQAIINSLSSVNSRLSAIENSYVKEGDLCSKVVACLPNAPAADPVVLQYYTRMVPYTYIPYAGPLSNFDNTGKGLASAGWDKIYIANGLNGTQDWRGRGPIGAIKNVPGGTLDTAVDPAITGNAGYNFAIGEKAGANFTILSTSQIPSHVHDVADPGHSHFSIASSASGTKGYSAVQPIAWSSNRANGNQDYDLCLVGGLADAGPTSKNSTGITIGSSGGGQAHTNLQPSVGCVYIVYIP